MPAAAHLVGLNSDELVPSEDEASLNPFFNVGQRKIHDMLAFALEDRLVSKRRIKNLQDIAGAPGQARARQLWFNYFKAFITDVMGHDNVKQTPTGPLFCRFFAHIIERLKSHVIGKPAYSKNSLKKGIYKLGTRLVWEYPDFRLTAHDTSRLNTLLATLVSEGKLTVGTWRKSQFIGFLTLRKILSSYISQGLVDGVRSWDVCVSRWLSLVLQASVDSRSGEVARSREYKGRQYLSWEDVEIKLVGGDAFQDLQARVTLRYEKGSKDDPTTYRYVRWRPLEHSQSALVDPIAVLMIHALRHGQTHATTILGVLSDIAAHPSKTLHWRHPDWPVTPKIAQNQIALDFTIPASTHQILASAKAAGRAGGLIRDMVSHDLRKGCAKDAKSVGKHIQAGPGPEVAQVLGHSMSAYHNGTTAVYAERETMFLLNQREQVLQEDPFGPRLAEQPYKPPGQLRTQDIDKFLAENPLLSRSQGTRRVHAKLVQDWRDEQNNEQLDRRGQRKRIKTQNSDAPILQSRSATEVNIIMAKVHEGRVSSVVARRPELPIDPQLLASSSSIPAGQTVNDVDDEDVDYNDINDDDNDDNESVNALLDTINASNTAQNEDPQADDEEMELTAAEEELIIEALDPRQNNEMTPTDLPILQFIDFFANINIVRAIYLTDTAKLVRAGHGTGNSRHLPTQFVKSCERQELGCTFQTPSLNTLDQHQSLTCIYREHASLKQIAKRTRKPELELQCSRCDRKFASVVRLNRHERVGHDASYLPKPCDLGCTTGFVYDTLERYKSHVHTYHAKNSRFVPQKCDLKDGPTGCRSDRLWTRSFSYTTHLLKFHKLDDQGRRQLKSDLCLESLKPRPCPIGDCQMAERQIQYFRPQLVVHLMSEEHKLSKTTARRLAGYAIDPLDSDEVQEESGRLGVTAPLPSLDSSQSNTAPVPPAKLGLRCPLGECVSSTHAFPNKQGLVRHLRGKFHGYTLEQAKNLIC